MVGARFISGSGSGSGSMENIMDPDPENDADPLDPDPQHRFRTRGSPVLYFRTRYASICLASQQQQQRDNMLEIQ